MYYTLTHNVFSLVLVGCLLPIHDESNVRVASVMLLWVGALRSECSVLLMGESGSSWAVVERMSSSEQTSCGSSSAVPAR